MRALWRPSLGPHPPIEGCFAQFNYSSAKTPKPGATRGAQPSRTPTAPQQAIQPKEGQRRSRWPKVNTPHGQCWQCGEVGTDHKWDDCVHPCLNCGGPGQHAPGGHRTPDCKAPTKGPHNKGFWREEAPPSAKTNHRQLPLTSGPAVATPLVMASLLTAQPYCTDLDVYEALHDPAQQGEGDATLSSFIMGPCTQEEAPGGGPADGRHSRPFIGPTSPGPLREVSVPGSPSPVPAAPLGPDDEC